MSLGKNSLSLIHVHFSTKNKTAIDYDKLLENPLIVAKLNHRMNANILAIHITRELIKAKEVLISELQMEIKNLSK